MPAPSPTDDAAAAFAQATAAYREGRLEDARAACHRATEADARHADAWYLLGLIHFREGLLEQAHGLFRQALAHGERPAYWASLGDLLKTQGQAGEAESAYRRALALDPCLAPTWTNLGVLLDQARRDDEAQHAFGRALAAKPGDTVAAFNLGSLLQRQGQLAAAQALFEQVLAADPRVAQAWLNLGVVLQARGEPGAAESAYRRAIECQPDGALARRNLGALLRDTGRLHDADQVLREAIAQHPGDAHAHNEWGLVLQGLGRDDQAQAAYEAALACSPGLALAHYNLGVLHDGAGRLGEAKAHYGRAMALDPGLSRARYNLALVLLAQGRLAEGWPLFEARCEAAMNPPIVPDPGLPFPRWQGEALPGRSLVVWPEQGFGDAIQFIRYVPLLKARGAARVVVACRPPLAALFETVEGVDEVVTTGAGLAGHDHWCPVMSLPLATGACGAVFAPGPYLRAAPDRAARWRDRLPDATVRVGLAWRGSAEHKNDARRSMPLAALAPLWSVPGLCFVALQKGQGEDEAAAPPGGQPLTALGAQMEDFADAAAIVSQLDLVICVDTAIAHLAGALGKPCWVLLPAEGLDWRWGLGGAASPWYPSLRLLRQRRGQGWAPVVEEAAAQLRAWALSL